MDVEAAFLEGKMNQPMYLKIPDILVMLGFVTKEQQEKFCISLMRSMYGNVDAALRFFIIFVQCLQNEDIGMTQSQADLCVMYMKDDKGMPQVVAAVTVDDCLLGGKPEDVTCLMEKVKKYFKISIDNNMERHLGVDYKFLRNDKNEIYLEATMEKKANDIVKFFEDVTGEDVTTYETPGIPGSVLKKNEGQTLNVEAYRTLVGKLMFYTTKVGLKQSNAVRDLSRHLENPGESHWMAMKRVVGYMKGQTKKGLLLTKPVELRMVALADADYAKDPVERKSVGGDIHTLGGCITSFSSRGEKSVSLSSTESEYKMLSNAAKEMKFEQMLLEEIASVKLPGIIFEDNSGAIYLVRIVKICF